MNIPIHIWILCIILPILAGIVFSFLIWTSYRNGLDKFKQARIDTSGIEKRKKRQIILFIFTTFVPSIYGIAIIILLTNSQGPLLHHQEVAVSLLGIVVGIPIMVSVITQGSIIMRFMKDFLGEKEPDLEQMRREMLRRPHSRPEPTAFGRYILIPMFPQTVATYGLLIGLFLLNFGSVLSGGPVDNSTVEGDVSRSDFVIDEENIDQVRIGSWVFAVLSLFTVSVIFLPFLVKGSMMDNRTFKWKAILSIAGTIPAMIGLAIWIISMSIDV